VAAHGFGFEAFAAEILPFHPEWAWPETGIRAGRDPETAREMARHRPATLVHPGRHATWYGDDAQRGRAIALLNALLGSWGRKGGFLPAGQHERPRLPYPPTPAGKGTVDNPDRRFPFASEAHHDRHPRGDDHREAVPGEGLGGLRDEPHPGPAERGGDDQGIQALDLLVVVDVVGSEIAGWADVVLPEATYLERTRS